MEGACGRIVPLGDGTVRKVLKRHRRRSLNAMEQVGMHMLGRDVCRSLGLATVYVPEAWPETDRQYVMEEIVTDRPLDPPALEHACASELALWFQGMRTSGVYACDFELYEQPDGRVAIVDVDKFATWKEGVVAYPWGERVSEDRILLFLPASWK